MTDINAMAPQRQLNLTTERIPKAVWLTLGPPAITAALIWWLYTYGASVPWRGEPEPGPFNHHRPFQTMVFQLILWNLVSVWMVGLSVAMWFGMSRVYQARKAQLIASVVHQWANLVFNVALAVALWVEVPAIVMEICVASTVGAIGTILLNTQRVRAIREANPRPSNAFYFDWQDAALVGERGTNAAHPLFWAIIVTGFLPAVAAWWLR